MAAITCDPLYNLATLAAARSIANDLRRPKSAREEALRVVRRLEKELCHVG